MKKFLPIRARWITAIAGALVAAAAIAFVLRVPITSQALRAKVIDTLSERLDANVELGTLTLHLFPRLSVHGTDLFIRKRNVPDLPPLIAIPRFQVEADLLGVWRRHVARVVVEGLAINIPPGGGDEDEDPAAGSVREDPWAPERQVIVDELVADAATLTILRREPWKNPRVWSLHELRVYNVGVAQPMPFRSRLTNAVPPGEIVTSGSFGPWNVVEPGVTPIDGEFTFERADLGVFKGISGILSAQGRYYGSLGRIEVNGQTDTPDFMVRVSGQTVPLKTTYRAIVDGMNGNTTLERIDASFLETSLVATGGVYEVEGVQGRVVTLDIDMTDARLEDVLRLAVNSPEPPMTGALRLKTAFNLPPGDVDVGEKLELDGEFAIDGGRFSNAGVQQRIADLSRRARGQKQKNGARAVTSDFTGRFKLARSRLTLSPLTFDIPGALVELRGSYALRRETLAFAGHLFMDAKLSQTMSGFKSALLKVVDPLFRRNGRTVIPLKIQGTRSSPKFGLDVKRVFTRK